MRLAILSALYPPRSRGGAEDCAQSFAAWAAGHGHHVSVVTAASEHNQTDLTVVNGVTVEAVGTPHIYPIATAGGAPNWKKPAWYLQDLVDARAAPSIADRLRRFGPDAIVLHYLQGFGYRVLPAVAELGVPIAFVLHDLGLVCLRMSMFKRGQDCVTQCIACGLSSRYKRALVAAAAGKAPLGFISPSQANLDLIHRFLPVKSYPHARILNTKAYPVSERPHRPAPALRLLYAGKLDEPKGISILAAAVIRLAAARPVTLEIAGAGPLEGELRRFAADGQAVRVLGFISQAELAERMVDADLLCVPSLWPENSPGVVVHALSSGLPVIATNRGGLPELVEDGTNGVVLVRHDETGWLDALAMLEDDRDRVARLRAGAQAARHAFDQDRIGRQTIAFIENLGRNQEATAR